MSLAQYHDKFPGVFGAHVGLLNMALATGSDWQNVRTGRHLIRANLTHADSRQSSGHGVTDARLPVPVG
jgi:hypothetical protein